MTDKQKYSIDYVRTYDEPTRARVETDIAEAFAAIERVGAWPDFIDPVRVIVGVVQDEDVAGLAAESIYAYYKPTEKHELKVGDAAVRDNAAGPAVIHEFAHLLDWEWAGDSSACEVGGKFIGVKRKPFAGWKHVVGAIFDTTPIQYMLYALRTGVPTPPIVWEAPSGDVVSSKGPEGASLNYLSNKQEAFARAFTQFVAIDGGYSPALWVVTQTIMQDGPWEYWVGGELEPLLRAFRQMFKAANPRLFAVDSTGRAVEVMP